MAQSLENRINAALRSAARLKDVEAVIAAVKTEIADTTVKMEAETARSIDPALTTPQAREARNNAADLEHDIRRLNASLGMLVEKRDKIIADNAEEQRRKRFDAAKAERDDLARHIRTRYPEIAMEMLALVRRINASNAACEAVNQETPWKGEKLILAEHLARGAGYYWEMGQGGGPVTLLSQINLPLLSRSGAYLPIEERSVDGIGSLWADRVTADQQGAREPIPGIEPAPAAEPEVQTPELSE